jgi:hypothetical protein
VSACTCGGFVVFSSSMTASYQDLIGLTTRMAEDMSLCLGSVIAVAFQSVFYLEMHQNIYFLIFKKVFLISAHQNDMKTQKILI